MATGSQGQRSRWRSLWPRVTSSPRNLEEAGRTLPEAPEGRSPDTQTLASGPREVKSLLF